MAEEPLIAIFIDYENLALGLKESQAGNFHIQLVLKRLLEKGRIVYKRAYCDWSKYQIAMREFHAQGIEMIDIPQGRLSGKNSADIRMVVDALDLCYSKQHIDMFALLSGDSDFSPLVSKLKENKKRVIGCGVKGSTSELLVSNCDEFICYDDLIHKTKQPLTIIQPQPNDQHKKQEVIEELLEVLHSIEHDYDPLWGSTLKLAIRRVDPGFNEGALGYGSFSALLEDLKNQGLVDLEYDARRGNYKIRRKPE